jgi:coenzyme Q-binding protein COQ10
MPKHSENKKMPYKAYQMFDLVSDIENYSNFLPWCSGARVKNEINVNNNIIITADLIISFKAFREKFTSEVTLISENNEVKVKYLDGPFKYLVNQWQFTDLAEGGCNASFMVDFEFKSKILQALIGFVFNDAMLKIVQAFEEQAAKLYDD